MIQGPRLAWLVLALAACGGAHAAVDWQLLDVNRDGRFDDVDRRQILKDGLWRPSLDINGDGKKDTRDTWQLLVLRATWDRNADLVVDASDFAPLPPLKLPEASAQAAVQVVAKVLREVEPKMPQDLGTRLLKVWPVLDTLPPAQRAECYEQIGAEGLCEGSLEGAQWGFAKAATADPARDSALANLAFTLAQTGRFDEALALLAQALRLKPDSAVSHNNLGWLYARHGQLAEARAEYAEAVRLAPTLGQYRLNLSLAMLRAGDAEGARQQALIAGRQFPGDGEALRLAAALAPATPADLRPYEQGYEKEREATRAQGDEPGEPWGKLSVEDQMDSVEQQVFDAAMAGLPDALKELSDEYKERIKRAVEPCTLRGKHWKEDWERWSKHADSCLRALMGIRKQAEAEARQLAAGFQKDAYARLLSMDNVFLQMALVEAQAEMAGGTGAEARKAFERTIDHLHTQRMAKLQMLLNRADGGGYGPSLNPEWQAGMTQATIGFMPIFAMGFPPAYYEGAGKEKLSPKPIEFDMHGLDEPIFSFSPFPGLGLEWDTKTNEVKLTSGVILFVAGTWSPTSGFGVQGGVGLEGTAGPLKVDGALYLKRGSDGSLSVDGEVNGGVEGGPLGIKWGGTGSAPIRAASQEPVGALGP